MRGVILAGGHGTRMAPVNAIQNKHLLPVYSKFDGAVPMIEFPIKTLVSGGIQDILIISSREHSGQIIQYLGDGSDFGADFSYKIQDLKKVQLGIASALSLAYNYTGDEDFAVILGDNIFADSFDLTEQKFRYSHVFLKKVDDPQRFGVVEWEEVDKQRKIKKIIEKPVNPPSNDIVTGLYLFSSSVYELINQLEPSDRGELEIIDVINMFPEFSYTEVSGFWSDAGTVESMLYTEDFLNGRYSFNWQK